MIIRREFTIYDNLITELNKNNNYSSNVLPHLKQSFSLHKRDRISEFDKLSLKNISYNRIAKICFDVITLLTNAIATYLGLYNIGLKLWDNFWYQPDSINQFLQIHKVKSDSSGSDDFLILYTQYESALIDILTFLSDEVNKSIIPIPITGLKHEEIRTFHIYQIPFYEWLLS